MEKTLLEIAQGTNTDKLLHHAYLEYYEALLGPFQNQPITLLEIGVAHGDSIKVWEEYLPQANIIGIDCSMAGVKFKFGSRVRLIEINQCDGWHMPDLFDDKSIDFVIDDGSHMIWDQVVSAACLMPKLKPTGIYSIEDISLRDETMRVVRSLRFKKIVMFDMRKKKGIYDDVIIQMSEPEL